MKRFDKIVKFVIIFALGACTYGFIGEAIKVYSSRTDGNFGGEVLIIPMIFLLILIGWQLRASVHK